MYAPGLAGPTPAVQIFRTDFQNFSRASGSQLVVEWNDPMSVTMLKKHVKQCMAVQNYASSV
jgi:hypothetical protein